MTWLWLRGRGKTAHAFDGPLAIVPFCGREMGDRGMTIASATTPRCKACVKHVREAAGTTGRA